MGLQEKYKNSWSLSAGFPPFNKMQESTLLLTQSLGSPNLLPSPLLSYINSPFPLCFCLIFPPQFAFLAPSLLSLFLIPPPRPSHNRMYFLGDPERSMNRVFATITSKRRTPA